MKTLYTLLLCIVFTSVIQAQKINYESSKWFWGANIGATWNSTDVMSDSYNGWGLTLGRSYNYDYGHVLSFDVRGRFLTGQWYGQANEYSTLDPKSNSALHPYLTGNNQYVHNFRTDVRELDLELVLHAAKLRERTGLDPFIFGGIGFTWQQNWTDLTDTSGLYYDYNVMAANGPASEQLVGTLDNIYETRLDGLTNNDWRVNWMPSLGFGLAYHRGRVSFGLEHKTTFTMADDFDGLQDQSIRLRNDWYHYTSAFIQIHFKGRGNRPQPESRPTPNTPPVVPSNPAPNPTPVNPTPTPNPTPNTNPTPPNPVQNCPTPEVSAFFPPQGTVQTNTQKLEFVVHFINSSQDIKLYNGQNQSLPFNYNSYSARVEAIVNLVPGINNFTLVATTNCGTDQQTVQVVRENCQTPTIQIQNNTVNNTVNQVSYNFIANVSGQLTSSNIQLVHNGMSVNGFNYNPANGQVQRLINLAPGNNIIRLEANSNCGNAAEQINITYNNCERPQLSILNPSAAGTTTNLGTLAFQAKVIGTTIGGQAQIFLNNQLMPTPTISGNLILASLPLAPGLNTIQFKFTNNCGTDQVNTTINYQNCVAPVISVLSPSVNSTVQSSALRLRANLLHVSNRALIKLVVNGTEQTSFTFNATTGLLEYSGQLLEGINNFTITAANDCGSDIETFTINYSACKKPTISFVNAPANGSQVNQSALNLQAQTAFLTQAQISLSLNGVIGQPFSFQNNLVSAALNLRPGLNTILIQGKNDCDRISQTINLTYTPAPCDPPQVIYNMIPTGSTVNNPVFTYYATVVNYTVNSNIVLSINGTVLSGYSNVNGSLAAELGLIEGANQISITVTNDCGTFTNTYNVTYVNDGTEGQQRKPTAPTTGGQKPASTNVKPAPTTPKPAAPKPTTPAKAKPAPASPAPNSPAKNAPGAQKSDTLKPAPTTPKPAPKSTENKSGNGGGR
jgi:hypothetical protein